MRGQGEARGGGQPSLRVEGYDTFSVSFPACPGRLSQGFPPSNVGKEEMLYFLTVEVSLLVVFSLTASALDGEKGTGKTLSLCHSIHPSSQ